MARQLKTFALFADPQLIYNDIFSYLTSEGYEYIEYEGENVFKKGEGIVASPTFFKITFFPDRVTMETWMKYALLPGVFVGEFPPKGFVGSAARGPWNRRIQAVESVLMHYSGNTVYENTITSTGTAPGNPAGAAPVGMPVSKKDYIESFAPPAIKKDIRNIALICYVCAGINAIFALMTGPLGFIDTAILAGLGLGIQLAKNSIFAYALFAYAIVSAIIALTAGNFPIWIVGAGVYAFITFNKINKQYKAFIANR